MTISVYDADGFYIGDYDPYAVEVEGGGSFTDFLIGPHARNITGQTITVDGGWTVQ